MRATKLLAAGLVLAGGAALALSLSVGAQVQQKAEEEKKAPPLIRMDLLRLTPAATDPPKRNIFSPRTGAAGRLTPAVPAAMAPGPGAAVPPPGNPGPAASVSDGQPAAPPVFSIDLRYVGFVDSLRTGRIIGLVIFQGQARAVVEGEVISEGIRIGKVTRKEIEVILPDSSKRTFSLEGEES